MTRLSPAFAFAVLVVCGATTSVTAHRWLLCAGLVFFLVPSLVHAQVQAGVQTGPDRVQPGPHALGGSSPGFVNFDDDTEPCFFINTTRVTDEFAAFGVTFSGPGGNDGGAVLDECSNFGVSGHSSPNFLAFNSTFPLMDGGLPIGPETMTFTPLSPAVQLGATVSMNCGAGSGTTGTATLECFDTGGGSLGSDVINIASALQPLSVSALDIASCVFSFNASTTWMVCDDLQFSGVVPVELLSFDAVLDGNNVSLRWATAGETNNAGFEVQMDAGAGFQALGFVDGNGTTTEAQTYSYVVHDLDPGTYAFRLKQIDFDGVSEYHGDLEVSVETPDRFVLMPAYPNPFNPEATVRFAVRDSAPVTLTLHDALGRQVSTLYSGTPQANQTVSVQIHGRNLPSGLYLVRLSGQGFMASQPVTLLK